MRYSQCVFAAMLIVSVCLIVGGFFVPPRGVIDGSILTAVGEIFAFACLAKVPEIICDHDITINHGDTSVKIEDKDESD